LGKGGYNGGSTVIRVFGGVAAKSKEAVERRAKKFGGGLLQMNIKPADADLGPPELIKRDDLVRRVGATSRIIRKTKRKKKKTQKL
jgi:hypothetical protein